MPTVKMGRLLVMGALLVIGVVALVSLTAESLMPHGKFRDLLSRVVTPAAAQDAKAPITEDTLDPALWGAHYPLHYASYLRTVDIQRTRFGGSEAFPRLPTEDDPRTSIALSKLEHEPRLKQIWAGYAFSIDYREKRGHAYMLDDQTLTERQKVGQPGTCLNCHSSVVGAYRKLGDGDLMKGYGVLNSLPFAEGRQHVEHPIACIDCHDPKTMALRITRPGFMEGIAAYKAGQEGVNDYDVNAMATPKEMRNFVCGQCHVEYYFAPEDRRLIYPWAKGLGAEDMLRYFDEVEFSDWTHARTGAGMIKAQHPEFELSSFGIHASIGVDCVDCHMPTIGDDNVKFTDHHVRSPLLQVDKSCQGCHANQTEAEILARAEALQETTSALEGDALGAIVDLIDAIESVQEKNADDARLIQARKVHRDAQFLVDYVISENSTGFHAPQEAQRVLTLSIEQARAATAELKTP